MKKTGCLCVMSTMVCILWIGIGWSLERQDLASPQPEGSGCSQAVGGMMGGMRQPGMQGMINEIHKGPMYGEYGICGMLGMIRSLHKWAGMLMAQRQAIGLTAEQADKLDEAVTKHITYSIRNQAETRTHYVDLGRELRKKTVDLQATEALLKKITAQDLDLQMEGIRLCTQVLDMLTTPQRAKAEEIIGTPFMSPFEEMPMEAYMEMPCGTSCRLRTAHQCLQKCRKVPGHHGEVEKKAE